MLPEIQGQGQVDKLQIPKTETILFLILRCPERSTDEQVTRSGTPALFFITFSYLKKLPKTKIYSL